MEFSLILLSADGDGKLVSLLAMLTELSLPNERPELNPLELDVLLPRPCKSEYNLVKKVQPADIGFPTGNGNNLSNMLPGSGVPGCCLFSFHILWAILCPQAVYVTY